MTDNLASIEVCTIGMESAAALEMGQEITTGVKVLTASEQVAWMNSNASTNHHEMHAPLIFEAPMQYRQKWRPKTMHHLQERMFRPRLLGVERQSHGSENI